MHADLSGSLVTAASVVFLRGIIPSLIRHILGHEMLKYGPIEGH